MPKENTHILFADGLIQHLKDARLRTVLESERESFLLGAIIPDTMYYSPHRQISDNLHGKDGNPTNAIILKMLDTARDDRNLAFCCGYITHCALDIIFHPVVYYLSGNYYDPDAHKRDQAVYQHRHIETCLDAYLKNPLRIYKKLHAKLIYGLAFENIISSTFGVEVGVIRKTLHKQLKMNRFFSSRIVYLVYDACCRMGLVRDWQSKGLFYANIENETCPDFAQIHYQDLISGENRRTSLPELLEQADNKACAMITSAYAYSKGEISREDLVQAIPGESLDTGTLKTPVSDIIYTHNS